MELQVKVLILALSYALINVVADKSANISAFISSLIIVTALKGPFISAF